jgi:hypothetical protein
LALDSQALNDIKNRLLDGMREYMSDAEVTYDEGDIRRCGEILDSFMAAIGTADSRAAARACVQEAVTLLNQLNAAAGEELIETDQREDICALIIAAGAQLGFNAPDEDVTEQWREW